MIRCIALDLDDTLLQTDLTISEANKKAIKMAQAKGIKVVLASGRMIQSMRPYAEDLGIHLPIIGYNGALIYDILNGSVFYHQPVPVEVALKIIPYFKESQIHLNVYINDQLYMEELTSWGKTYAETAGVVPHPIGELTPLILKSEPHKMLGFGEKEDIDRINIVLQNDFAGKIDMVKSKPSYLELLAPGVSKGNSLRILTESWGIGKEEVMAIGDAPNDLSMIEWAGVGVAIGNAYEVVKEKADLVVSDHNHDGVAEAIAKVIK